MTLASRYLIPTPALVLDLDAFEANADAMMRRCAREGIALRPHAKTHKSSTIARRQMDLGAVGICCATIEEAAAMAAAGVTGILVTSPIVSLGKMAAIIAIAERVPDISVVADNADNVVAWNVLAQALPGRLSVLVDLDVGQHRTGVTSPEEAVRLARTIAASDYLLFAGVQAYAGHIQHIADYPARLEQAKATGAAIRRCVQALTESGLPPRIVSGGGTGTHAIEPPLGALNELQAGSYVFMDAEYAAIAFEGAPALPFRSSLFVQSTVISANVPGFVQTDAGTKAFATNGPPPEITFGAPAGSTYSYLGDEHGRIALPAGSKPPRLGDRIECLTPHCDPTVNLYDHYVCVRGETVVGTWPIDARRS